MWVCVMNVSEVRCGVGVVNVSEVKCGVGVVNVSEVKCVCGGGVGWRLSVVPGYTETTTKQCHILLYCTFTLMYRLLLTTCYMGTVNSSSETRERARKLAEQIGR